MDTDLSIHGYYRSPHTMHDTAVDTVIGTEDGTVSLFHFDSMKSMVLKNSISSKFARNPTSYQY